MYNGEKEGRETEVSTLRTVFALVDSCLLDFVMGFFFQWNGMEWIVYVISNERVASCIEGVTVDSYQVR